MCVFVEQKCATCGSCGFSHRCTRSPLERSPLGGHNSRAVWPCLRSARADAFTLAVAPAIHHRVTRSSPASTSTAFARRANVLNVQELVDTAAGSRARALSPARALAFAFVIAFTFAPAFAFASVDVPWGLLDLVVGATTRSLGTVPCHTPQTTVTTASEAAAGRRSHLVTAPPCVVRTRRAVHCPFYQAIKGRAVLTWALEHSPVRTLHGRVHSAGRR